LINKILNKNVHLTEPLANNNFVW